MGNKLSLINLANDEPTKANNSSLATLSKHRLEDPSVHLGSQSKNIALSTLDISIRSHFFCLGSSLWMTVLSRYPLSRATPEMKQMIMFLLFSTVELFNIVCHANRRIAAWSS